MTTKEKAKLYDALQVAIKMTIDSYRNRKEKSQHIYEVNGDRDIIGAFEYGCMKTYEAVLEDMERWIK